MKFSRHNPVAQPSLAAGSPGIPARCSEHFAPDAEQGCSPHPQAGKPAPHHQRGIALVVTLILLSVVTFLAVAFLFLARRERGAVTTAVDTTIARRAAEAGTERAKAEMMAKIISTTNRFDYGLLVSTNFINAVGFQPGISSLTNVNYDYANGARITGNDLLQNLANLFYSPRPPVFIGTNPSQSFRFYLDLNRNQRFDTNGEQTEIGMNGLPLTTLDTNGTVINVSNFYVGDPEWVGILERPDRPHSPSNKFIGRFVFALVPSGKTLDLNALHNQSKLPGATVDGFSRNMGFGPWELNLASFLVDLNTNIWQKNNGGPGALPPALVNPASYYYNFNPWPAFSTGTAFEDALALTRYRYGGNWNNLRTVRQLFGNAGANAFQTDGADGYGSGPLMLTNTPPLVDGDAPTRVNFGWPGADNPNHFFTTQDLFDPAKTTGAGQVTPNTFSDRLMNAGYYGTSSYDRYTYYRMLAQLGTDSAPDPARKIHLNYVNVTNNAVVPDMQTNFVAWAPLQFFTNSADALLRATFPDPNFNVQDFGVNAVLSLTNIPVFVSNRFVYTPSLHRVLQLTANIWDASANKTATLGADFPSVFRPTFRRQPNGFNPTISDIYIAGFVEVGALSAPIDPKAAALAVLDLNDPIDRAVAGNAPNQSIYGVPWVIGAKKGFPNFNEFAMQSITQISRKLQLRKQTVNSAPNATNQMFVLGVSNVFAFEAWNSYRSDYTRDVQIIVANRMSIGLTYTNDALLDSRTGPPLGASFVVTTNAINIPANFWKGYGSRISSPATASFLVPLQTNIVLLADSILRTEPSPYFTGNSNVGANLFLGFEQTKKFPLPQFTLSISNHILFMMIDTASQRIVDYVQLGDLNGVRNLTSEVTDYATTFTDGTPGSSRSEAVFWDTNRTSGNTIFSPPMGVINQIQASLGFLPVANWQSIGTGAASGQSKQKEIDGFKSFMLPPYSNTNLAVQAPFTPTRKTSQYITWQANDPLVHYTGGDLSTLTQGTGVHRENPNGPIQPMPNIGLLNTRFEPWGGTPISGTLGSSQATDTGVPLFSVEAKDPGVRVSDDWDFPTNRFATVGMLGRVHRGTPWQTIYMKAGGIGNNTWSKWTGNSNTLDLQLSKPVNDRVLFDVFTTAVDQDATRGQLNVNQTGLAAWSAFLGGAIALTNSSTDDELNGNPPLARVDPYFIDPAGTDPTGPTNSVLGKIFDGVNRVRAAQPYNGAFKKVGDVLAVPELTVASPLLNTNKAVQLQRGINDATYERLPQMLLGLMRGNDQPRVTIYAYGQALHPANRSIVTTSGPYYGLCTNYQITAEFATRTVVRIDTVVRPPPDNRLEASAVVEGFNVLSPE